MREMVAQQHAVTQGSIRNLDLDLDLVLVTVLDH